jgi:hypothetical protein
MYKGVLLYLDTHSTIWTASTPIAEQLVALKATITEISEKGLVKQQKNPKGYTKAKHVALDSMMSLAHTLALRVKAYAKKESNEILLQKVSFTESTLKRGTATEIINRCTMIAAAATEHLPGLAAYKVTGAEVDALLLAVETAKPKTAERDTVTGERISIVAALVPLFTYAKEQAKDLDDLVEAMLGDEHKDFVTGYFALRRVNNRRGGQRRMEAALPVIEEVSLRA